MKPKQHASTLDHFFRTEYGKVMSILIRKFGTSQVETIEDALQDTFIKAMKLWGHQGIPEKPTAWLLKVAHNRTIDLLRKHNNQDSLKEQPLKEDHTINTEVNLSHEISDSQLRMLFACCDPSLSTEYQLILSLKLIGGFSNKELATALLKNEETVAKGFTRAKKKFKADVKLIRVPQEMGLQSRLFVVLRAIYLLFSEGYATTIGAQGIKRDICYEAMRLALLLRENPYCQHANLDALIALMCFHVSRFSARLDTDGELISLQYHDRSLYDQELIQIGTYHLKEAGKLKHPPSSYHLEAAVSYHHSTARTFDQTNWRIILQLYDAHLTKSFAPIVALNRIIALHQVKGPQLALDALEALASKSKLDQLSLFYAIKAELFQQLNKKEVGATAQRAIDLTKNVLVQRHLKRKFIDPTNQ
ncbi:MAG: sigma-70 family RNA polymerase sigma factor [Bacteroidota bacterium]